MAVILVTGGAGYIGSHTVLALQQAGFEVVVADDFSEGHLPALRGTPFARGSLGDRKFLNELFGRQRFAGVVHFAARCYVGESMTRPGLYYENNVVGTLQLLETMVAHDVRPIVFSSSCATYGQPASLPIREDAPQLPVSPYGRTKFVCELLLRDFARAHGIAAVALRYFNAAGADPEGRLGEDHRPETHLIPLVLAAAAGRLPQITIHGDDYPTPDGTCIRDYVHVSDLADAHVLALQDLLNRGTAGDAGATAGAAGGPAGGSGGGSAGGGSFRAFNLGNERGHSVREVIATVEQVTGRTVPHVIGPRRPGDPPVLVGSPAAIQRELGWTPTRAELTTIVKTAWEWHRQHPEGYPDA